MKIAIVHDYIKEYGGAEKVLETLLELYPGADVFTSVYLPSFLGPHEERFKSFKIKTSPAQYLPFKAKLISPLRIIAPHLFRSFDFSGYDVIIVSQTGGYFPNSINKKKAVQICYCHTPPRYLYGYATAREWKKKAVFRILGETMNHFLRMTDFKSAQNVDYFLANSENVRQRIRKFYRKDSVVIYPPVDISKISTKQRLTRTDKNPSQSSVNQSESYYLAGGRLARPKHIDIIVEAFSKNGLPLKIFGKAFAGYGDELKSKIKDPACQSPALAGRQKSRIEFLGEIAEDEKYKLMSGAEAFVFASEDEDFGITPVEAMSLGIPVIAYKSGGVLETVIDGKTGLFFKDLSVESLNKAIEQFKKTKFDGSFIKQYSQKFSKERFKDEIKNFVNSKVTH